MVRKVSALLVAIVLICAYCTSALATTHTVYENGTLSTTYTTYFKDILSGAKFNDNYVAFRSGQYSYTMVVGDLEYDNGKITLVNDSTAKEYTFSTNSSNYNSTYYYDVKDIYIFDIDVGNNIIYSDVGDFPQLIDRGAKYETLNTLLIIITLLCVVVSRIFYNRKR